jgi:Zincin-like metallopeptidase
MDWYVVIKTINGRRYRYRQKTWRENGRIRTRSEYIGPADGPVNSPKHPDLSGATTLSIQFSPRIPKFNKAIVDEALRTLMDPDAPPVFWRASWDSNRSGTILVQRQAHIEDTLQRLGVKRTFETRGAYYNPLNDVVNIPPMEKFIDEPFENATQAYYSALLHELVHWTKGAHREGRLRNGSALGYAKEELVAELGALILMKHFGLTTGDLRMHTKYFQGWLRRAGSEKMALKHAKLHATRAVRFILERGIIPK